MRKPAPKGTPSFSGLAPASPRASAAARAGSRKRDTSCELTLRSALWKLGLRYRVAVAGMVGKPDIVFPKAHVAVFCDGDFWHGRNLEARLRKLRAGHNSAYWVRKIERNVERDREHEAQLQRAGWRVLRFWETDIIRDPDAVARCIVEAL